MGLSAEQVGTLFANIEDIYEFSRSGGTGWWAGRWGLGVETLGRDHDWEGGPRLVEE